MRCFILFFTLLMTTLPLRGMAEIEPDEHGSTLTLPETLGPHWVWLSDPIFRHSLLFDGDTGEHRGTVDATWSTSGRRPYVSRERGETYVVETVYARGHRGERRDFVTIYDSTTLAVRGEIEIPPTAADIGHGVGLATVLDGGRFLIVFNHDPANSVSVVDLEARRYVGEIVTAGCACVYPVGPHRFGTLCGDGTALLVDLDDTGRRARLARSEPFFDPVTDPLTEKGTRDGERWLFASFEGYLHEIDFSGDRPVRTARWSLFSDAERTDAWRIGGIQHLALHRATRRLYSLVHQGGPGTHKDAGTQIWVYDLEERQRVQIIDPPNLYPGFLRPQLDITRGGLLDWLLYLVLPNRGVHSVAVTQDDRPLLFVRHREIGATGVLDGMAGTHLRDLEETGLSGALLAVP